MAPKKKLSLEAHEALGNRLYDANQQAVMDVVYLNEHYPNTSKVVSAAKGVEDALMRLRSALDNELAREYPDEFSPDIYYPAVARRMAAQGGSDTGRE